MVSRLKYYQQTSLCEFFITFLIHTYNLTHVICLKPKVTVRCYYIYLFLVLVSAILNVLNSY